jgi:hypothetical protein
MFEYRVCGGFGRLQEFPKMSSAELVVDLFYGVAYGFYCAQMFVVLFFFQMKSVADGTIFFVN